MSPSVTVTEKTFSSYNKEQGKNYSEIRRDYSPKVYQAIIDHHTFTDGKLDTLLDVGCGPGLAALALAKHFNHVFGLDPSDGMISTAQSFGGVTSTSEPVRFEVSSAEELGRNLSPPIQDSSVDLITASNAAHWFDMNGFWPSAARVLKPGGTVAIWTGGPGTAHPDMPNAEAIQAAIDKYLHEDMKPYQEPGNVLVRDRYIDLPLPWTLAKPVPEFDESTFLRQDWSPGEEFFVGLPEANLDVFEKMLRTGSAQQRWAQAHPEDVGTERDPVKKLRKELESIVQKGGVEIGKEMIKGSVHGVILFIKKKET